MHQLRHSLPHRHQKQSSSGRQRPVLAVCAAIAAFAACEVTGVFGASAATYREPHRP